MLHGAKRNLNGESGRLALEFDQVSLAQKLLEQADDPANPDWRVISARGRGLAKQGIYRDAIAFYQRALALAPNVASILNYLALAHAMLGEVDMAEPLLKRAAAAGGHEARLSQNQYEEAKLAAARDLPPDKAAAAGDGARPQSAGAAIIAANDDKSETPSIAAKSQGPQSPYAKDNGPNADVSTADAASGWTTKVARPRNDA
jgi:tetratricopeptide (TPR) repeat protein